MAHLNIERLSLPCNVHGLSYFPSGFRDILRCELSATNGRKGLSEWAPLESIHDHSIEQVMELLSRHDQSSVDDVFDQILCDDSEYLARYFRTSFPYPISFIMSVALFNAQILRNNYSIKSYVKQAVLILPGHSFDYIKLMLKRGYRCLKIKINGARTDDIERIKMIRSLVGSEVELRLDANKKLSFDEAKILLHATRSQGINYIEEPLGDISRLAELYDATGVNMALDESICEENALLLCHQTKSKYVIIKASRFNSIYSIIDLCKKAQSMGISPIFSPCFESDFYCSLMLYLIDSLELHNSIHGIYTDIWA